MGRILTPTEINRPRIVTLAELERKLIPICGGDRWGLRTIHDLWKTGAPIPNVKPDQPEQRVLLPGQFQKWFADVNARVGRDTTPGEQYGRTALGLRGSGFGAK